MIPICFFVLYAMIFSAKFGFADFSSINHLNISSIKDVVISASTQSQNQKASRDKVTRKFPLIPLVQSPRIMAFYDNIYDQNKHCGERSSNQDSRPTFRGGSAKCIFNAPMDRSNSFFLDHGQRTRIKDYIVSNLLSTLKTDILLYSTKGTSKPINLESHTICKLFKIPESHKTNGLDNVDIIFYVAAGPQKYNEHTPAWADVCHTSKDQPIVVALNINAQMITQHNIVESVTRIVKSALNVSQCNGNGKSFLRRDDNGGIDGQNCKCITVNCDETNEANRKVKYWSKNKWQQCETNANCPSFDDICNNWIDKEVTQTLTFSESLTHSKSITSSITETTTQSNTPSLTKTFTQTPTYTSSLTFTFTNALVPTATRAFSSSLSVIPSHTKVIQKDGDVSNEKGKIIKQEIKTEKEKIEEIYAPPSEEEKRNKGTEIKTSIATTTNTSSNMDHSESPEKSENNVKKDEKVKSMDEQNESLKGEVTKMVRKSEENGSSKSISEESLQEEVPPHNWTNNKKEDMQNEKKNQIKFDSCSDPIFIHFLFIFSFLFVIFTTK